MNKRKKWKRRWEIFKPEKTLEKKTFKKNPKKNP